MLGNCNANRDDVGMLVDGRGPSDEWDVILSLLVLRFGQILSMIKAQSSVDNPYSRFSSPCPG